MWTEVERRVHQKNAHNLEELWELSHREWDLILVKMVKDLHTSLPKCIKAFIQAKGSHMKY